MSCSVFPEHFLHVWPVKIRFINEMFEVNGLQVDGLKLWKLINFGKAKPAMAWRECLDLWWNITISSWGGSLINKSFPSLKQWLKPIWTSPGSRVALNKTIIRTLILEFLYKLSFGWFSYLLISHCCIVNFPSLSLIHAWISDLKHVYCIVLLS